MLRGEAMEGFELISWNRLLPFMALKSYQLLTWESLLSILFQAGSSADVFGKIKTTLDGNVQFGTVHSWLHNSAIGACNQKEHHPLGITHWELWWNYSTGCVSVSLKLIWCVAFAENAQDTIIQTSAWIRQMNQMASQMWHFCSQCQRIDTKYPLRISLHGLFDWIWLQEHGVVAWFAHSFWILMLHCSSFLCLSGHSHVPRMISEMISTMQENLQEHRLDWNFFLRV